MPRVFLSYRRDDTQAFVGRLSDRLGAEFGRDAIFLDVDAIPPGVDFRDHLSRAVRQCQVFIAIIGDRWIGAGDDGGRRLDDPADFVRTEIEQALAHGLPVIPLLVGHTPMPAVDDLPASLEMLAYRNALAIDPGRDFHHHADRLIQAIVRLADATVPRDRLAETGGRKAGRALVFVSGNRDKFEEYRRLLGQHDVARSEIDLPDSQEMNPESIVRTKIAGIAPMIPGIPFFVDHTGLVIDAWKGMPGGLTKTFMHTVGSAGICRMLAGFDDRQRTARVRTVIGFHDDGTVHVFSGSVLGRIAPETRGLAGFGWDDIFVPAGETATYAELPQQRKDLISMRRKAAVEFAEYLALRSHCL